MKLFTRPGDDVELVADAEAVLDASDDVVGDPEGQGGRVLRFLSWNGN
ncbi:hypothetical protein [Caballeronia sp. LZ032]|nr:hypothetical protein [Caballeronia sp. LZ032]MDR5880545.1 hypothetical protein [Caballeronia sp. LZ032]